MFDDAGFAESMSSEQLDVLGDEIATFAARIDVAEHALLTDRAPNG
jgi:hypothetical protein